MQVAHRQNGGISTGPLGLVTPWSALCHIGSRCPGRAPRPIAAQTRQGFSHIVSLSMHGEGNAPRAKDEVKRLFPSRHGWG